MHKAGDDFKTKKL